MNSAGILEEYLKQNSSYGKEEIALICSSFGELSLPKEKPLFTAGGRFPKIVFIARGILRVFIVDDSGEEIVKNFGGHDEFLADIDSFENNLPALINVSAVTDCSLLTLTKAESDMLMSRIPGWELTLKTGALNAVGDMIRKQNFLRSGDAVDQYRHFVSHYPELAQQVPLKYIASFLRITQSSLSRIRKQGW